MKCDQSLDVPVAALCHNLSDSRGSPEPGDAQFCHVSWERHEVEIRTRTYKQGSRGAELIAYTNRLSGPRTRIEEASTPAQRGCQ